MLLLLLKPKHVLTALIVCCVVALHANGIGRPQKCRCIQTSSDYIAPRFFKKMEIVPAGANCRLTQIIITKKDNFDVCVDPESPWIKKIIHNVLERQQRNRKHRNPLTSTVSSTSLTSSLAPTTRI